MRTSFFLLTLIGMLTVGLAEAKPRDGLRPDHVQQCDVLKGGTRGLHGLCVSFCKQDKRDKHDKHDKRGKVDLNKASLKAAAGDVRDLRRYNRLKRAGDPEMPCLLDDVPPPPPDDVPPPSDDEPPPPAPDPLTSTSCECWAGDIGLANILAIDGMTNGSNSFWKCTSKTTADGLVYEAQVMEGHDNTTDDNTDVDFVRVAAAATDEGTDSPNLCFIRNSPTGFGIPIMLDRAAARQCITEVETHCASLDASSP